MKDKKSLSIDDDDIIHQTKPRILLGWQFQIF
jgi:hypothetical protein